MLNKGPLKDGFDRPDGVLLFLGPTGVGKDTRTCRHEPSSSRHRRVFRRLPWLAPSRKLRNPLGFLSREAAVEQVQADIRREAERRFAPEFLNRIDDVGGSRR